MHHALINEKMKYFKKTRHVPNPEYEWIELIRWLVENEALKLKVNIKVTVTKDQD